ncbi:hypothetical protein BDW69DRAFT_185371 [Aspergillus filifer]
MNPFRSTVQPQSPFFTKLPPEIRCQIYEFVFADVANTVNIFTQAPSTTHSDPTLRFQSPGDNLKHRICSAKGRKRHVDAARSPRVNQNRGIEKPWPCDCTSNIDNRSLFAKHRDRRIPLLLTCRATYTESLQILWSLTTLHLEITTPRQCRILSSIQWALSHSAFHVIRSIEVSFAYSARYHAHIARDGDPDDWLRYWTSLWEVLATMEGLRKVKVWIDLGGPARPEDGKGEGRVLGPLLEIAERLGARGQRREVDVSVSWGSRLYEGSGCEPEIFDAVRDGVPFVLRRAGRGSDFDSDSDWDYHGPPRLGSLLALESRDDTGSEALHLDFDHGFQYLNG